MTMLPRYDRDHAPEHHVRRILAQVGPPPRSMPPVSVEAWSAMWREHVDLIWREAYVAGAVHGQAIATAPLTIVIQQPEAPDTPSVNRA